MTGFRYGTLILMGDNTYKQIQDITENEYVMSYDEDSKTFIPQIVVCAFNNECDEVYKYTFEDGTECFGCEHLRFLTIDKGYTTIESNDIVISINGTNKLISKELVSNSETLYELDIEDIDNFVANNVVVHNAIPTTVNCTASFKLTAPATCPTYLYYATSSTGTKNRLGALSSVTSLSRAVPSLSTYYFYLSSSSTSYVASTSIKLPTTLTSTSSSTTITRISDTSFSLGVTTAITSATTTTVSMTLATTGTYSSMNVKLTGSYKPSTSIYLWRCDAITGTKAYLGQLTNSNTLTISTASNTSVTTFFLSTSSSTYTAVTAYKLISIDNGVLHSTNSFSVNFRGSTAETVTLGLVPQHTTYMVPYIVSQHGNGYMPVPYAPTTSASFWVQEKAPGASYGFKYNGLVRGRTTTPTVAAGAVPSGYYAPTNANINSTASVMRVYVVGASGKTLTIKYLQSSEQNYDYGLISNLDSALITTYTADSTVGKTLKGVTATTTPTSYTVAISDNNVHFVDIKYRKDTSTSTGWDAALFNISLA